MRSVSFNTANVYGRALIRCGEVLRVEGLVAEGPRTVSSSVHSRAWALGDVWRR